MYLYLRNVETCFSLINLSKKEDVKKMYLCEHYILINDDIKKQVLKLWKNFIKTGTGKQEIKNLVINNLKIK